MKLSIAGLFYEVEAMVKVKHDWIKVPHVDTYRQEMVYIPFFFLLREHV